MPCDQLTVTQAIAPSKATIYNLCWGSGINGPCSTPPSLPAVQAGSTINIVADVANVGGVGRVMVNFKINNVIQNTETNISLAPYPSGPLWSATYSGFSMPNSSVNLVVEAFGYDGTNWTLSDTQTMTISPSSPSCTGVSLSPYSANVNTGGKVTLSALVTPGNVAFNVTLKDDKGNVVGTCKTTGVGSVTGGSTCSFVYTAGSTPGTVNIIAYSDSCSSNACVVVVAQPIYQYNLNVTVLDKTSGVPVSGATILANTVGSASQSKTTDINGNASFRLDAGTINIAISKDKYNTLNDALSLFSDVSITEYLAPIPPTPTVGDVDFISVPTGAAIYIDGKNTNVVTPVKVTGISAGPHSWSLKLSGYNDSSGNITVQSGGTTEVYASLTPSTPTTGSLNINSTPMGAEIFIDGKDSNLTTSGATIITAIPPGQHSLILTIQGYQDLSLTVTVTAGQTTYVDPTLTPLTTIGSLDISSDPSGARIYIDDLDTQYTTPATISNIKQGDHYYKVILSGYKDVSGKFSIIAGNITTVHIVLEKTEGLGTVATIFGIAAAAVAVVAFAQKKKE